MVANIKQGTMTVAEYEDFFYSHEFVWQQNDKQYLISIAKAGLNEEIREGLETPEFPTLEALFEEAMEVKEILEMDKTPPSSPIKRPENKRPRKRDDNRPRKRPRYSREEEEDEEEEKEEEEEGDMSDDTLSSGKFRMYEYRMRRGIGGDRTPALDSGSDA
ncbi:hypothetical protein Bca52824_033216 [Brassica carinata]|uniref:Retrotransposon gag domain-containing protein n=1 Tax=Brassica carinata TaxID=52824 RepID=A0A8X7SDI5_BRACI|nr:hypothetical protein Bca52824_033216 [Brassica carinata]